MPEKVNYNPDILSCLANLSSDEVFTPPEIANAMLDMLPQELFTSPDTKFLDPGCKSGVFLREIAKRLNEGLKDQLPDVEQRMNHIMKNQLFAIAITQITGLLSRRSVYCSKDASGRFSVARFNNNPDGNIRFRRIEHKWDGFGKKDEQKCVLCGAPRKEFDRGDEMETHAYEFVHMDKMTEKELKEMKFDVIIGNPPYQLTTNADSKQARPIYPLFCEQAKKLQPRFMSFIIPSRWFAGGMGLDSFRDDMMKDSHVTRIVDYANAKECFPQNSISGGVCYFLWERDKIQPCVFTNISGAEKNTMTRHLDQFPVLVRYNKAISVIEKVSADIDSVSNYTSPISPFGIPTSVRGINTQTAKNTVRLFSSAGVSYIEPQSNFTSNKYFNKWKVLLSQTSAEHAGEPSKDGMFKVLTSSLKAIPPQSVCSHSYILIGPFDDKVHANNLAQYLTTKFVRFLILMALSSIHISRQTLAFVPMQDFSKPWTDEELYKKYGLTDDEIAFIESMIKPMDGGADA